MAVRALVAALVLALAVFAAIASTAPPTPVPASAPATEFSAERAMRDISAIATRPHPTGTPAARDVRATIVRELDSLGFEVDVQDATSLTDAYARRWGMAVVAGHVRNVVALRRGTAPGPALLLMAHYDSRELAPGASDDGYGCGALLETARVLAASPPLRHDVILLFTEGEEPGLLGARAFLESPTARQVGLVLNFEARGDRGPAMMFQTSPRAEGLVDALARAVPHVAASSLSQEVYRRMPNDTDLTPFLQAGYAGMNFANVDGFERYHQPTDTAANADAATVQQLGSYAARLALALGDRDELAPPARGDAVYFDVGPLFVHYPAREGTTLAGLATGLLSIAVGVGLKRGRFRAGGALVGTGITLLAVVLAGLAAAGAWWATGHAHDGALGMQTVRDVVRKAAIAGFLALGGGVAWAILATAMRRVRPADLAMGATLVFVPAAVATAFLLPGASYLFAWPLLASGAAWCLRVAWPSLADTRGVAIAAHLVAPIAAALLVVPVAVQLGVAFGPAAAPALAVIGALAASVAVPLLDLPGAGRRWIAPASLLGGAVACVGVACALPPFDAASPRPDSLVYAVDGEHRAWWVSFDGAADDWTGRALSGAYQASLRSVFPRSSRYVWQTPAPRVALPAPRVEVVSDAREGGQRTLKLHVALPPGTEVAAFDVPPEAHVTSASVQGKPFAPVPQDGWLELAFFGPPEDGLDVTIVAAGAGSVPLTALAQTRGLPAEVAAPLGPRPPDRMPAVGSNILRASDMTLTAASFAL
jgi:hypothetical protein